jgi:hypothetical protein
MSLPQPAPQAMTDNLDWLVDARNKIQSLMLRLYRARDAMADVEWQLSVGAAFSLWRAVFLAHQFDDRPASDVKAKGVEFLKRIIENNAIGFCRRRADQCKKSVYRRPPNPSASVRWGVR